MMWKNNNVTVGPPMCDTEEGQRLMMPECLEASGERRCYEQQRAYNTSVCLSTGVILAHQRVDTLLGAWTRAFELFVRLRMQATRVQFRKLLIFRPSITMQPAIDSL